MSSATPNHRNAPWRPWLLRVWRLGLLVLAVVAIQRATARRGDASTSELAVERVRDFFPKASSLGPRDATSGMQPVRDASGITLGYVAQTAPESDEIIGYSGPTNTLIALDSRRSVTGLRVLRSGDTSEHLAEVVRERGFFEQFKNKKADEVVELQPNAVSGATLTSSAIAEGVLRRLGRSAEASLRFPDVITLDEVRAVEPRAAKLVASAVFAGGWDVFDAAGAKIAVVVRSAPAADGVVGYKGPTDTLMLMDAEGWKLRALRVRRSYDTEAYLGYVTSDPSYLKLYDGMDRKAIASIDFDKAGVEGVSGATQTSWGIAEGVRVRAEAMNREADKPKARAGLVRWRWQDAGHALVIVAALVMAFTRLRGVAWCRHAHHVLLVVYAGFVSGEILSQGMLAGWAATTVPWRSASGLVLLAAVALLAPVFTGKQLYCHHICPHGALQQLLAKRLRWQWSPARGVDRVLSVVPFVLLALVFGAVVTGVAVDLNALEPFDAYLVRVAGMASVVIALAGVAWSLVTPLAYCRYGCPTGALFKLLRFTGHADRLGVRDWIAAALIASALAM